MERVYRIPIMGAVKNDKPLQGIEGNPLCAIPLTELPGFDMLAKEDRNFSYATLDYNVDEEWVEISLSASEVVHDWLLALIPQLRDIAKTKGWRLDKAELEKVRKAREL